MKTTIVTLLMTVFATLTAFGQDQVGPDIINGESLFKHQCVACHDENAVGMATPVLHGQFSNYLIAELMNFKYDRRKDLMFGAMPGMAKALSDSDIVDVATYLEKQSPCVIPVPVDAEGADVKLGKVKADQIGCLGCHRVKNAYGAPRLDGQKNQYIVHSLKAFRSKDRISHFMNVLAPTVSDADMLNLAAFMNSLRKCSQN